MKLRYFFSMILASALFLSGCEEVATDSFDNIKLSQTYLSIAEAGGSVDVTVTATEDWAFVEPDKWPDWLSVDKMSGSAGETVATELGISGANLVEKSDYIKKVISIPSSAAVIKLVCRDIDNHVVCTLIINLLVFDQNIDGV